MSDRPLSAQDFQWGPRIRDEVVLRTACGCMKIVSVDHASPTIRVVLYDQRLVDNGRETDPRYITRTFIRDGTRDTEGRAVFAEQLEAIDKEDWKLEYQKLYNEVYGMDKGL